MPENRTPHQGVRSTGCLLGPHEGTGQGLRTVWWGVSGDTIILTDVGTASVEQVLVHHRHAILGEKTGQKWEGRQSSLPSQRARNGMVTYKNHRVPFLSWLVSRWASDSLPALSLRTPWPWPDPNTYQTLLRSSCVQLKGIQFMLFQKEQVLGNCGNLTRD